jgi:hypothetical protein
MLKNENLKVLSSERSKPKLGSFDIKKRATEVFRKLRPSPILGEPFQDFTPSHTVFWQLET